MRFGLLLHAFSAFASFCARVNDLAVTTGVDTDGTTFPEPANVSLAGAPKIAGCGEGAGLHESAVVHGGGTAAGGGAHGTAAVHSCAS